MRDFHVEKHGFVFTPAQPFSGSLRLHEYRVLIQPTESEIIRNFPFTLSSCLPGSWRLDREGYGIGLTTQGPKLKSGRRSAKRRLVSVDVAWPHDPWKTI